MELKIDLHDILEIEQYFRVSRNAVLVRLIQEEYMTSEESEQYKRNIVKNAKSMDSISHYTCQLISKNQKHMVRT